MKSLDFGRCALICCATVAMLAGCGGSQPPIGALSVTDVSNYAGMHQRTFNYTGKAQSFKVPSGISQVTVKAQGASGPSGQPTSYCKFTGGNGGIVKATIPVTPGETLAIYVGGEGGGDGSNCSPNGAGGFNGGGDGGNGVSGGSGTGGGGASDVREGGDSLTDRVVVAGGGGGGGVFNGLYGAGSGGAGGGKIGGNGSATSSDSPAGNGGYGGTQHHGGPGPTASKRSVLSCCRRQDIFCLGKRGHLPHQDQAGPGRSWELLPPPCCRSRAFESWPVYIHGSVRVVPPAFARRLPGNASPSMVAV